MFKLYIRFSWALYKTPDKSAGDCCSYQQLGIVHVVVQEWCRSSSTSKGHHRPPSHMSKPLRHRHVSRLDPSNVCPSNVPAPRPFSPFSSSSSKRKFRGTLAAMLSSYARYLLCRLTRLPACFASDCVCIEGQVGFGEAMVLLIYSVEGHESL